MSSVLSSASWLCWLFSCFLAAAYFEQSSSQSWKWWARCSSWAVSADPVFICSMGTVWREFWALCLLKAGVAGRWLQEGCSCLWAITRHSLIQAQHVWTVHQSCTYVLKIPHFFQDVKSVQAATCHTQNFPKSILLHLTLKVNNLIV